MNRKIIRHTLRLAATAMIASALVGCNTLSRLADVNGGPKVSNITNPTVRPGYQPVSMPMPAPAVVEENPNSLWRAGARAFFKDHRAKEVGDIITVSLSLSDSAKLTNVTTGVREDTQNSDLTAFLGWEAELAKKLPQAINTAADIVNLGTKGNTSGDGAIDRKEDIALTFAAVVTQVLPNGALVVFGRQEIKVNSEMRELMLTGVIRPEDIAYDNTIAHTKIAEMRVTYGGRGSLSDLQQPRWGTQLLDIIFPF
ncbi:MAG: flagellar basal body L-ring protein [Rhodospirillales bacterium RIFCSPLOWO2_12_FULL_58_28]|nr:MAG: flagellar basal body L-ring protein [Rhodospirillales bacterium RIFCSPLOWO2_02_FULL_58_16]OHC79652.1 MAG: flagellar basal body L-ring protein [Rhodospirillales bacterium RIFCSPLOWO2_12_FULL_58_28]